MFRSASARQSDLATRRFTAQMDYWTRTANTWFDGTTASVDERIAQLDTITRHARDTVARIGSTPAGFRCGAILPDLEHTRRELAAARDSLLNGFSDRQDAPRPAGRRTANYRYAATPEEEAMQAGFNAASPPGGTLTQHGPAGGAPPPPPPPPMGVAGTAINNAVQPIQDAAKAGFAATHPAPPIGAQLGGPPPPPGGAAAAAMAGAAPPPPPPAPSPPPPASGAAAGAIGGALKPAFVLTSRDLLGGPKSPSPYPFEGGGGGGGAGRGSGGAPGGPGGGGGGGGPLPGSSGGGLNKAPSSPAASGPTVPGGSGPPSPPPGPPGPPPPPPGAGGGGLPGVSNIPSLPRGAPSSGGSSNFNSPPPAPPAPPPPPTPPSTPTFRKGPDLGPPAVLPGEAPVFRKGPDLGPPAVLPGETASVRGTRQHLARNFTGSLLRAIVLGSRDFVADQNTDDRDEILFRARRYAAEETSTLPVPIAHRIAAAFVGQVEELIARRPRTRTASRQITAFEDFDDSLMY